MNRIVSNKIKRTLQTIAVLLGIQVSVQAQMIGGRENNQPSVKEVKASALGKGASTSDVNLFTGTMNTSYTLGTVSTPSGLSFTLSSSYSSTFTSGGETTISSGIPYGEGWNLNIPSITITTESFSKYDDSQVGSAAALTYDNSYLYFNQADAQHEGDLVWFEPQINIPGVINERFIYKYTDPQTAGHVFVPAKFDKYVEAIFYNGGSWDVITDDGTKYFFSTRMTGYRSPSNQRVYVDTNVTPEVNLTRTPRVLDQVLLPKEEFLSFYCNSITNPNHRNAAAIQFQYQTFGKFNYFQEYSNLMSRLRAVIGQEVLNFYQDTLGFPPAHKVPDFSVYKDIFLTKVESQTDDVNYLEELVLDYKTINSPDTKDMLRICETGVHRLDSLYNYKTVWTQGIDSQTEADILGSDFYNQPNTDGCNNNGNSSTQRANNNLANWWRYNHGKSDQAVANTGFNSGTLVINPNNPYKIASSSVPTGGCGNSNEWNYLLTRNPISSSADIPFTHSYLESPRIGSTDCPPGDIYEVKSLIYNQYAGSQGSYSKAFCNFDVNVVSGDNTSAFAQNDIGLQNPSSNVHTVCEADYESRRYRSLFTTFNQALKWNSAGKATLTNQDGHDAYMKTSNLFVMPNLPKEYQGFHIQVGPGNSDTKFDYDYNTNTDYMPLGNSKSPYYNTIFDHLQYFTPMITSDIEPCDKIPHNFGIGMPWYMTDWLWSKLDDNSLSPNSARYKYWWFDQTSTICTQNPNMYPNVPTAADQNVKLAAIELVRYSKNPFMLSSVKQYKTNGANNNSSNMTGRVLVNQLNFEYEVRVDSLINNRAVISSGAFVFPANSKNWVRNVFLLKKIIQVPTNGSQNNPTAITNASILPTTQFNYTYKNFNIINNAYTSIQGFYSLTKIIDQMGGETSYEFYPLSDSRTRVAGLSNWDINLNYSTAFGGTNYANPSPVQRVIRVSLIVQRKVLSSPTGSTLAKDWLYDFTNPVGKVGIVSSTGDVYPFGSHYKVSNASSEQGFINAKISHPLMDNMTSRVYDAYEHYSTQNDYLLWGKLKSSKSYDAGNNLLSEETDEYAISKAYANGMYRDEMIFHRNEDTSEYSLLNTTVPSVNIYNTDCRLDIEDAIFQDDFLENTSPSLFSALDTAYLNSYFVAPSKQTKTDYDIYTTNSSTALTNSNVSPGSNGSMRMASSAIASQQGTGNTSNARTIGGNQAVQLSTQSLTNITEYQYWDAGYKGITKSEGYKNLLGLNTGKIRWEPSWQLFRKKSYSPDMPDAYTQEDYYYYYDLLNDFANFDDYDLLKFGQGSGGTFASSNFPTLFFLAKHKVRDVPYEKRVTSKAPCQDPIGVSDYYMYDNNWSYDYVFTDLLNYTKRIYFSGPDTTCTMSQGDTTVHIQPKWPCVLVSSTINGKNIGYNEPCTEDVYYNNDHYQCPCGFSDGNPLPPSDPARYILNQIVDKVMLRYTARQIDTVRIDSAYTRLYNNYNHSYATNQVLRFKPVSTIVSGNTTIKFVPEFPYDTLLNTYIDKRESNGLIELAHNATNLFTEYKYTRPQLYFLIDTVHYCNNTGYIEIFNAGVPTKIIVGKGLPDSLVTNYLYNPDFTVDSIIDPNGMVTHYEYDSYSRLAKAYRNGQLLTINKYSQFTNNLNLSFEDRAAENFVESFILLDTTNSLSNIAEHSRAYEDPLGRKLDILSQITNNYNSLDPALMYGLSTVHSGLSIYDNWDRVIKQYKPFIQSTTSPTVFQPQFNNVNDPYSQQLYENNQRSRVLRTAKFGENITTGHTVNSNYHIITGTQLINELKEPGLPLDMSLVCNSSYLNTSKFLKAALIDEDGKRIISYTNAVGQKVASKAYIKNNQAVVTRFYYDSHGNMIKIKNPAGQESNYSFNISGLMYSKHTPDAGKVNYMYNSMGQLVLEQDSNALVGADNNNNPYLRRYTYDNYGRMLTQTRVSVTTGANPLAYKNGEWSAYTTQSPFTHATSIDRRFNWYTYTTQGNTTVKTNVNPYSLLGTTVPEKAWYYDFNQPAIATPTYSSQIVGYLGANTAAPHFNAQSNTRGKLTQTYSYDHSGQLKNICVYSYNNEGLPKWEITQFNNGSTQLATLIQYKNYNLRNGLKTQEVDAGFDGADIRYDYVYDGWGRLTESQVNQHKIAGYTYNDALGLIQEIKYYTTANDGTALPIDTISYAYDVRDRLTQLSSHLYTEKLYYDAQHPQGSTNDGTRVMAGKNYNGNINGTQHSYFEARSANASSLNGLMDGATVYGYTYDGLNRLTNADASVMNVLSSDIQPGSAKTKYGDEKYMYDKIGNILNLQRGLYYNPGITSPANWVQNWNYAYQTGNNRLLHIDSTNTALRTYTYDGNGNLRTDTYKSLGQSRYTRSNLPYNVTVGTGSNSKQWEYEYDANDNRIYKKNLTSNNNEEYYLVDNSGKTLGVFDITNNTWKWYAYANNRSVEISSAGNKFYEYDHLGNTRVTYSVTNTNNTRSGLLFNIEGAFDYYASGKTLRSFEGSSSEMFGYQGSEKNRELGDNDYYTHFRGLDVDIVRWKAVDPVFHESESPYVSMGNNPILSNDVLGNTETHYFSEDGKELANTNDGHDGGIVVSKKDEQGFTDAINNTDKDINGKEFNDQWRSHLMENGSIMLSPLAAGTLSSLHSDGARAGLIQSIKDPSLSNNIGAIWGEYKGQWSDKAHVVTSAIAGLGAVDAIAGKGVSPNVQKVLNAIDDFKGQGGTVKVNPLNPSQEVNLTFQNGNQKLDFRIETHPLPIKYGGDGVTPQKHMNVDLYPNKKVLPNSGHKILD